MKIYESRAMIQVQQESQKVANIATRPVHCRLSSEISLSRSPRQLKMIYSDLNSPSKSPGFAQARKTELE